MKQSEFMCLQKLKNENIPEVEYISFHYSRLVAIQEKFFTSDDPEDYFNFCEIHLREFHDIVQVSEPSHKIVEAWEKCKEYERKKNEKKTSSNGPSISEEREILRPRH